MTAATEHTPTKSTPILDLTSIRKYGAKVAGLLQQFRDGLPSVIIVTGGRHAAVSAADLVADLLNGRLTHARPGAYATFRTRSGREVAASLEEGRLSSGKTVSVLFLH